MCLSLLRVEETHEISISGEQGPGRSSHEESLYLFVLCVTPEKGIDLHSAGWVPSPRSLCGGRGGG
jgi:hypothetical protein